MPSFWPIWRSAGEDLVGVLDGEVYHLRVRLEDRNKEGLLIDPGAVFNLVGERWVEGMTHQARRNGKRVILLVSPPSRLQV